MEGLSRRRARRARRIARAVVAWRRGVSTAYLDIPLSLLSDPRWRERHLLGPWRRQYVRAAKK